VIAERKINQDSEVKTLKCQIKRMQADASGFKMKQARISLQIRIQALFIYNIFLKYYFLEREIFLILENLFKTSS